MSGNLSETAVAPTNSWKTGSHKPIVLKLKNKKKKKKNRKYSRGLKDAQQIDKHLIRAADRLVEATAKGSNSYRKSREKSAQRKRDGAIHDFIPNAGKALSHSLRTASGAPGDVAKALNNGRARKRLLEQLRRSSRTLRIVRY